MKPGVFPRARFVLLVLLSLLTASPVWSETALLESPSRELGGMIEVMEDPGGEMTLEEVRRSDGWQDHPDTAFNKGYSQSAWWIRWSLTNSVDSERERILSIDYPLLRDLQLHIGSDRSSEWQRVRMGAGLPFNERPYENRRFALPVTWEPGETRQFYLRVRTDSSLQVPLTVWEPSAFQAHGTFENTIQGIYLGALIAIGLYNLLLFLSLRDRTYLYYVGVVFSLVMLVATMNGYTFRYLWPDAPDWNSQAIIVFFGLTVFFAALFTRDFLEIPRYSRWLNVVILIEAFVGLLMVPLSAVVSYYSAIVFAIPFAVFATLYGPGVGIYVWTQGQHTARYYVLAWSFLLFGLLILALSKGGILPSNVFTDSAGQVGSFMEVLLLSFALAQRINVERRLRFETQKEMLDASERHNRELEARVRERTTELERLNQQLNEISITDGLTGLKNRRYLDEALPREIARAERNQQPLSVVMVDIDHFKPLNDDHGHQAGDACLESLGHTLDTIVRAPDIAVRYGGEEFALVLIDADAEGALRVVERLRQQMRHTPVTYDDHILSFTVSAGVATRLPEQSLSGERVIYQADQALYRAKQQGRDQVCVHDPERDADTELARSGARPEGHQR